MFRFINEIMFSVESHWPKGGCRLRQSRQGTRWRRHVQADHFWIADDPPGTGKQQAAISG